MGGREFLANWIASKVSFLSLARYPKMGRREVDEQRGAERKGSRVSCVY